MEEMAEVLSCDEFRILSSPVQHYIPTMGLRFEFGQPKKVIAYSCDTEPTDSVVRLAGGADVLIHEASGAFHGHSSATQAAGIARQAEVGELDLIHYPSEKMPQELIDEASQSFDGPVKVAQDFMEIAVE
jgi:ribonuclease Z